MNYDPLNRLTDAEYSTGRPFEYDYDAVGNIITKTIDAETTSYTYDIANQLIAVDEISYTWDDNGNLLSDGSNSYTYDHANRLIAVENQQSSIEYRYNGHGDRLQQTADGVTTNFTLDMNSGLSQVLADGHPGSPVEHEYLYGLGRIAQYDNAGEPLYFLADALGDVRQLVNAEGEVDLAREYEPYGKVLSEVGEATTSYGFTGEWTDNTGLVYLRARYYSPTFSRFTSRDTWAGETNRPSSYNEWLYAYANPVNIVDPSGMCPDKNRDGKCDNEWKCNTLPSPYREWCLAELGCWKTPSRLRHLTDEEKLVLTLFVLRETSQKNGKLLIPWPAEESKKKIWALLNKASFDADKINKGVIGENGMWTIYVSWHGEETKLIHDTLGPEAIKYGFGFDFNNFDMQFISLTKLAILYEAGRANDEPPGTLTKKDYFSIVKNHVNGVEPLWYTFGPNSTYDVAHGGIGFIDAPGLCKDGYKEYPNNKKDDCEAYVTVDNMKDKNFMDDLQRWFESARYAHVSEVFEVGVDIDLQKIYNFTVYQNPPNP